MRMIAAAPYALQPSASAFAGSQPSAIRLPSALTGTLDVSPFFGVSIRHRQSSVTIDTQLPVMSIGAAAFGVGGGPGGAPRCADSATANAIQSRAALSGPWRTFTSTAGLTG